MVLTAFAAPPAQTDPAPAPAPERPVRYAGRTEIEFGELEVNADYVRPSMVWVDLRTGQRFPSLVRLRQDWRPEMAASVDEIK
jgi:hypothetical protein